MHSGSQLISSPVRADLVSQRDDFCWKIGKIYRYESDRKHNLSRLSDNKGGMGKASGPANGNSRLSVLHSQDNLGQCPFRPHLPYGLVEYFSITVSTSGDAMVGYDLGMRT